MGRPTTYEEDYYPQVAFAVAMQCGEVRFIYPELAKQFDVSVDTLRRWIKKYDELAVALKRGQTFTVGQVEHSLYRSAMGFHYTEQIAIRVVKDDKVVQEIIDVKKYEKPVVVAQIFFLKNMASERWKDRAELGIETINKEITDEADRMIASGEVPGREHLSLEPEKCRCPFCVREGQKVIE